LIKQAASSLANSDGAVATAEPADEGSRWHMWLSFTNGKWQITKVLLDTSAQGG